MDLINVVVDFFVQLLGFYDLIYQTVVKGFLCGNGLTQKQHLFCLFLRGNGADELHSWCGAEETPFNAWSAEGGFFRSDYHIAGHSQLEAASCSNTVYCAESNDWQSFQEEKSLCALLEDFGRFGRSLNFFQVVASREDRALAFEDENLHQP